MKHNYILVDLDGTIIDSRLGIINCIKYALTEMGREIPEEDTMLQFIGPPLVDGFQNILGMSEEDAVTATAKYRERYGKTGLFEAEMYQGIDECLHIIRKKGYKLSLATSKPEEYATRILEHFGVLQEFHVVTGSTLKGERNTKAEVIEEAIHRLGDPAKEEVLMVGDRKHDILGAKQCNIASLGVYYGFAEPGELETAGAEYIAKDMEELKQFFDKD